MNKCLKGCYSYIQKDYSSPFKRTFLRLKARLCMLLGKVELPYVEVFVTTRCNLRCKNCSQLMPYQKTTRDISFDEFKKEFDALLSVASYIYRLRLHGGEPLLNKNLYKMLYYADSSKRIGSIRITTNGSVMPSKETLEAMASTRVVVKISDYSKKEAVQNLISAFENYGVSYVFMSGQQWKKFGEFRKYNASAYEQCLLNRCTCVFDGKLYVCSRAAMAVRLGLAGTCDSVDIFAEDAKKLIKCFYKKNDFDICSVCSGAFDYSENINAGEQIGE